MKGRAMSTVFMTAMSCGVDIFKALPKVERKPYVKTEYDLEREERAKQKRFVRNIKRLANRGAL